MALSLMCIWQNAGKCFRQWICLNRPRENFQYPCHSILFDLQFRDINNPSFDSWQLFGKKSLHFESKKVSSGLWMQPVYGIHTLIKELIFAGTNLRGRKKIVKIPFRGNLFSRFSLFRIFGNYFFVARPNFKVTREMFLFKFHSIFL